MAGFEPAIPASEPSQTYALDRAGTGIRWKQIKVAKYCLFIYLCILPVEWRLSSCHGRLIVSIDGLMNGMYWKGSGVVLIKGKGSEFSYRNWEKPRRTSVGVVGVPTSNLIGRFLYTRPQGHYLVRPAMLSRVTWPVEMLADREGVSYWPLRTGDVAFV
jgi:hypothetical protein